MKTKEDRVKVLAEVLYNLLNQSVAEGLFLILDDSVQNKELKQDIKTAIKFVEKGGTLPSFNYIKAEHKKQMKIEAAKKKKRKRINKFLKQT